MIPLVDLKAQYATIKTEIDQAIEEILVNTSFVGGPRLEQFERNFAAYCEAGECVGVANGTDALALIFRALSIGPGDEIITTTHTFAATVGAIMMCGATPVLVDIEPQTMLLCPDAVERAITPKTRAIVPVHLYGQPCDMDRLGELARAHSLPLIEDAAQAHGARWQGRRVGSLGTAAAFSFYPGKNLGAYGDGGAVVSDDSELMKRIRQLANHGRRTKYEHDVPGVNSRLDALQAAVLDIKLAHLDSWSQARRQHAAYYAKQLSGLEMTLPRVSPGAESVWHLFVVRTPRRDELARYLERAGVATGMHYPVPNHLQTAFANLGYQRGDLPHSEGAAESLLSLPLYPELTNSQRELIVSRIRDFFA